MREAARQRNIVVHADWESTDGEGYTYSTLRFSDGGMEATGAGGMCDGGACLGGGGTVRK
jgi:hypothetical protein